MILIGLIALAGCVSKSKAKMQQQTAFMAGQQQALERALQARNTISVIGPVRNPTVPWTEDLTLAKAIVAAQYYPGAPPREIVIMRNGQPMAFDPKRLLAGEDFHLEAGDIVNIR